MPNQIKACVVSEKKVTLLAKLPRLYSMEFIDLQTQRERIQPQLEKRIQAVLEMGQFILGPEVAELERKLEAFTGAKHAITVANGTDALQLALMALRIGPGDEVITTPFSFVATTEAIVLLGATPVFVDIDPKTYNLDPAKISAAVTSKTKAILPVSLYGLSCDIEALEAVALKHKVAIIEDAAQSFGASQKKRRSCSWATLSCSSFFPSKPLGCYGDGGACFTNDSELANLLKQIRAHGQDRRYHHPILGVNSRLDTLQAAVLLAKMEIFEDEIERRQGVAKNYHEGLKDVAGTPTIPPDNISVFAQYTIQVKNRDAFLEHMKRRGIPTAVHYPTPLHLQPAFSRFGKGVGSMLISEAASERVVSLPMHPYMKREDQMRVIAAVQEFAMLNKDRD